MNKVTDGLWPVVVGVKDPDVVVNEASHKRIFPKILFFSIKKTNMKRNRIKKPVIKRKRKKTEATDDVVFEDAMNDGGKETANERRSRMESTVSAEGGAHFARRRLSFQ